MWSRHDTFACRVQLETLLRLDTDGHAYNAHEGDCSDSHNAMMGDAHPAVHGVFSPVSKQVLAGMVVTMAHWYECGNISTASFLKVVHDISGGG